VGNRNLQRSWLSKQENVNSTFLWDRRPLHKFPRVAPMAEGTCRCNMQVDSAFV
jgi:hypothetical protein